MASFQLEGLDLALTNDSDLAISFQLVGLSLALQVDWESETVSITLSLILQGLISDTDTRYNGLVARSL